MRINSVIGFFIAIVVSSAVVGTVVDRSMLKSRAETQGMGYKLANLEVLSRLSSEKFGAYKIAVPEFVGVSYVTIQQELKTHVDIAAEWAIIINTHFVDEQSRQELYRKKVFPAQFLQDCKLLRDKIAKAYPADFAGRLPEVKQFLANHQTTRMMVRSTGKEDTEELANAGGNESIANVPPTVEKMSEAIRDVIISYFSEKSLKQRLGAEDPSLTDPMPFTPVLVQRMVNEESATPSKCGVMFTEDPEGSISRYGNRDSNGALTSSGITIIDSAFGHNEGVVNSLIPVDTYYVDNERSIYPIIRNKTYRMAPTEMSGELKLEKNSKEIATSSSLSHDVLMTLKTFANKLEQFYQRPMDVEFVVMESERTIYLVQARPLVHNQNLLQPSYVDDLSLIKAAPFFTGTSIGTAGGAVRVCNKNQTIVAESIGKALMAYQDRENAGDVSCIIVGKYAPSTSHEATSFRTEAKPVLFIPDWQTVEKWFSNESDQIILSPQQHIVAKWRASDDATKIISPGFVNYPAPPNLSVATYEWLDKESIDSTKLIALFPELKGRWQTLTTTAQKVPFLKLFQELQNDDEAKVRIALASLLIKSKNLIKTATEKIQLSEHQQNRALALEMMAMNLARQILANVNYKRADHNFGRRLLPIQFLQTLIMQPMSLGDIVNAESFIAFSRGELALEQEIMHMLRDKQITLQDQLNFQALKISRTAITDEVKNSFIDFILDLDQKKDAAKTQQWAKMFYELGQMNLLTTWLNTAFFLSTDKENLLREFYQNKQFFDEIARKRAMIDALSESAFANEKTFPKLWHVFTNDAIDYFLDGRVLDKSLWTSSGRLEKLAALSLMRVFVDKFDLAIKEQKTTKNIERFRLMIEKYFAVAKAWYRLRVQLPQTSINQFFYEEKFSRIEYVVFKQKNYSEKDLSFSKDFDVSSYISALATFGIKGPETLEDAFSAIHQSLLETLDALAIVADIHLVPQPPILQRIASTLQIVGRPSLAKLNGVEMQRSGLQVHYNYPLREHSLQYTYDYKNSSPNQITLRMRYAGGNEGQRWNSIAEFFELSAVKFRVADIDLSASGVVISLVLDDGDDLSLLSDAFAEVETYSSYRKKKELFEFAARKFFIPNQESFLRAALEGGPLTKLQAELLIAPVFAGRNLLAFTNILARFPDIEINNFVREKQLDALTDDTVNLKEWVRLLIDRGISIRAVNSKNRSFYKMVLENGFGEFLANARVDLNAPLNARGDTLSRWATMHERALEMLPMLHKNSSFDINLKPDRFGGLPLPSLCATKPYHNDQIEVAKLLLAYGAKMTAACVEDALAQKSPLVQFFIDNDLVDKSWIMTDGTFTKSFERMIKPLAKAAELKTFFARAVDDINAQFADGDSLLHFAVKNDEEALLRFLVTHDSINIDAVGSDGYTALHWAVFLDKPQLVRVLVENGADTNLRDSDGLTVMDYHAAKDPLMSQALQKK